MEKLKLSKAQIIGLFVLLTLITVFVVVNFLRGQDIFNRNTKYYTVFKNVEGLTATGPIYIRGLKVGQVESIKYNNIKDSFLLKLSIKSDYAIPSNSTAEIYSSDIMGSKAIRIAFGDSNTHLVENDTIKGIFVPDLISALSAEMGPLKDMVSNLMVKVDKTFDGINNLLDTSAVENLKTSFEKLKNTMNNAEHLSKNLYESSPELKELISNLNILSQSLKDGAGDIKNSLSNINQITTTLTEAQLKETLDNLKSLIEKMQDPNGSLGKLINTDSLHNSLEYLLKDIDTLVNKISNNPKKYIRISVF